MDLGLIPISEGDDFKPLFLASMLCSVSNLKAVEPRSRGWIYSTRIVGEQEGWVLVELAGPVLPRMSLVLLILLRVGYTASHTTYYC